MRIRVRARGGTPSLRPAFELIRPGGAPGCSAADQRSCLITSTGTYTVLVRDQSPGNRTGGYELSVQRLNDPVGCAAGAFGPDAEPAELASGETGCVRFEGVVGDRIRFRSVAVHAMDLVAEIAPPRRNNLVLTHGRRPASPASSPAPGPTRFWCAMRRASGSASTGGRSSGSTIPWAA